MLKENLELKELCLYLDKERENGAGGGGMVMDGQRDQGDGSSNSTTDGQLDGVPNGRQQHMEDALTRTRGGLNGNPFCDKDRRAKTAAEKKNQTKHPAKHPALA